MKSIKNKLDNFQDLFGRVLSLSVILLVIVIVYTAGARYLFNYAVDWGYETAIFIFGIYSILSGAFCLKEKAHVRVDILPKLLSNKKQNIIDIFSSIIIIIVSSVMSYSGSIYAYNSTRILERSIHQSAFNPQIWWFKWMIPIAAILILLQAIVDLYYSIILLFNREEIK